VIKEVENCYLVPMSKLFMWSSRIGLNPNELLEVLKINKEDFLESRSAYLLSRQQYAALQYKAGVKKNDISLDKSEEEFLKSIPTSLLIEEIETRTRG
jgi:hypothetical protein